MASNSPRRRELLAGLDVNFEVKVLRGIDESYPEDLDAYDVAEYIAQKKYNTALSVLAELLADKNNEPIAMLAMLGMQMRRLYAARLAIEQDLGSKYLMDACGIKQEYIARKLINAARGYTLPQLIRAVELCAQADYKMKSSAQDSRELLKEVVLRIAAGEEYAAD